MPDNEKPKPTEEQLLEAAREVAEKFFSSLGSMCPTCAHQKVCKLTKPAGEPCKEFLNSGNHKRYGNIYDLFQPIFDWMEYHYPSGGVKFIVDKKSAIMHLEHGVSAYSKAVTQVLPPSVKEGYEQQKGATDETHP